jgi:ABC-type multidrug transport system fused ATPase/permease subunit
MKTFKKLLLLLDNRERKIAFLLLIMIIMMALADMIGVASILPFISVLTNPELIETNSILNGFFKISNNFGVQSYQQFFFILGAFVFITLILSLALKAFVIFFQVRFIQMREYSVGKRLVEGYLCQPYSWFLSRHSAELGKTVLSEVQQLISNGLNSFISLIAQSIIAVALIILLIIVNPMLAVIVGFTLGTAYVIIFSIVRNYLNQTGNERLKNNQLRFMAINEAFSATKEIKVGGLEQVYIQNFSKSAKTYAKTQSSAAVIGILPRYILEAIAFGGILLIILYYIKHTGNFTSVLPIISLYVFAGYRLMPALQQIYSSFTKLTFVGPSLDKVIEDLKNIKSFQKDQDHGILLFDKFINLKNIFYEYPNSQRTALKDISLNIPAKSMIGLVGPTGSGKTTLIDILLGLLEPQKGILEVDGKIITDENKKSWQRSIGYVPQNIYLSDDTIARNIAFGVDQKNIDYNLVEKVSKIAQLHSFVNDELPKKYLTTIGERGVRLSGGQRQRIGIARALYHKPKVLILDEATSALDNQTEKEVMDAVSNINKDLTIILIAHRLNTVKNCHMIYKLDNGQFKESGTFEKLFGNINVQIIKIY